MFSGERNDASQDLLQAALMEWGDFLAGLSWELAGRDDAGRWELEQHGLVVLWELLDECTVRHPATWRDDYHSNVGDCRELNDAYIKRKVKGAMQTHARRYVWNGGSAEAYNVEEVALGPAEEALLYGDAEEDVFDD